jgi:hypothetical protein
MSVDPPWFEHAVTLFAWARLLDDAPRLFAMNVSALTLF